MQEAYYKRIILWDLIYLYDVIIYSDTVQSRLKQYDSVFTRQREAGRKFMCALISPSVLYLGHVVKKDWLHPNPITVDNVLRCKTPQNVKETQQTLKKEHTFFCYLFIDHCSFKTINVMAFQTFSVQHQTGWTAEYCNMPLLTSTVYLPGLPATQ